jgi:hypothetical protein
VRIENPTQCYVDESVHRECRLVVSAFVFAAGRTDLRVARVLKEAGLRPGVDECKYGAQMAGNSNMQAAREGLLSLASFTTRVGVFVGQHERGTIGRHSLQTLQSIIVKNGIRPSRLDVYFDEDIFRSPQEARRLHALFHHLRAARIHPKEDSRRPLGIQIADAVAGSFGQIVKEALTGRVKEIDIGGPNSGHAATLVSLGWGLLMSLRHALLTRPMVYRGESYAAATDPGSP